MGERDSHQERGLLYGVYFIYFFCGMAQCFEGVFLPEFKEYFGLDYQQQMYTMFAKNIPFLLAPAIGVLAQRIGFKNCLSLGMVLFAGGTLLFLPGLQSHHFAVVLIAFFIIGAGFNFQLVAGNPLLSTLGPPAGGSSRLNLGNALGAVAQVIAPLMLTFIIPVAAASVQAKLPYMEGLFGGIGAVLVIIAGLSVLAKGIKPTETHDAPGSARSGGSKRSPHIWNQPKVLLGFITIFLVLGAEAGLFGLYRNYLEDPRIAGLTSHQSERLFTVYFGLFALGRLVGAGVQKRIKPAITLAVCAAAALLLVGVIVAARGSVAIVSVTFIGFFISIFFPTLYALAIEGLGKGTAPASGLLTMGFLGCAFLPVIQGRLADRLGLQHSYAMLFVPYLCVLFYALRAHRRERSEIALQ